MQTGDWRGAPSTTRMTVAARGLAVAVGALTALLGAPGLAFAAAVATASPTPACIAPPCTAPAAAQLTLTQSVDQSTAIVGETVHYTVTLKNGGALPAAATTVNVVMSGSAGYLVADGTGGTANSFTGQPLVTVTRIVTGHYSWTYAAVNPGDSDVVTFSAVVTAPHTAPPATMHTITLTSTASAPGTAAVAVSTTAPFLPPASGGGVRGARSRLPPTGSGINAALAGFLVLGGLGSLLLSEYARERRERR